MKFCLVVAKLYPHIFANFSVG